LKSARCKTICDQSAGLNGRRRRVEEAGVDMIVASGFEAVGHRDSFTHSRKGPSQESNPPTVNFNHAKHGEESFGCICIPRFRRTSDQEPWTDDATSGSDAAQEVSRPGSELRRSMGPDFNRPHRLQLHVAKQAKHRTCGPLLLEKGNCHRCVERIPGQCRIVAVTQILRLIEESWFSGQKRPIGRLINGRF
jgi:hypothetical protein